MAIDMPWRGIRIWLMERSGRAVSTDSAATQVDSMGLGHLIRKMSWGIPSSETPGLVLLEFESWDQLKSDLRASLAKWGNVPVVSLLPEREANSAQLREALDQGLSDFLLMPLRSCDFLTRLQLHIDERFGNAANQSLQQWKKKHRLEGLVGNCPEFLKSLEKIPPFASADATVLILGESGSGKELFARGLHYCSPRQKGPFVPVNCGALPEQLFENELFGHAKGAYTDAQSNMDGLLAVAEHGTLFLDEVDGLALSNQVKLLRFLQNREYRPLGSTRILTANIRVVAAMNGNPEHLVETGRLREDLYHRLNILRLVVPPLRHRVGDVIALAEHYLDQYSRQHKKRRPRLSATAIEAMASYSWPGNIRELEAVVQRAVLLSGLVIEVENLDLPGMPRPDLEVDKSLRSGKSKVVESFERSYLVQLLQRFRGNVSQAAGAAGKDRRTFQRLLRKYGLHGSEYRGSSLSFG
jgi:DNA-binding NtrC family response regulator